MCGTERSFRTEKRRVYIAGVRVSVYTCMMLPLWTHTFGP
jgi:hypothetical protein